MVAVVLVALFATERDRAAARIVLAATLVSHFLVAPVERWIMSAWMLVLPGAVETATILCLFRWARNRTGFLQSICLAFAWLAHLLCYVDIRLNTDAVYSRYETVLAVVAMMQVAAFHDTFAHNLRRLAAWIGSRHARGLGFLRTARRSDVVLRDPGSHQVPAINPNS